MPLGEGKHGILASFKIADYFAFHATAVAFCRTHSAPGLAAVPGELVNGAIAVRIFHIAASPCEFIFQF